jgi:thiamine biosynthesis lipoprotein
MATTFRITLYAADAAAADRAAAAAFARIDALDRALSDWNPGSALCVAAAAASAAPHRPVPLDVDLARVLARGMEIAAATDGAFDPTIGRCTQLWRRSKRRGELPEETARSEALAATGHRNVTVDREARTLASSKSGIAFDLGGIAKGDALDQAMGVLREHGIRRAIVVGGGDVLAGGPPPGRDGWIVGLAGLSSDPTENAPIRNAVSLADAALATSGDLSRAIEVDGTRYSHIVDPRTGLGLTERRLVTARALDGATADALATALCVGGPDRAEEWLAGFPGSGARVEWMTAAELNACTFGAWPPMMAAPIESPRRGVSDDDPSHDPP